MWKHRPPYSELSARIRSSRNPQGSSRGGSNVPPSTRDRGRGRDSLGQQGRGITLETVNRPTTATPARAYAMRAREDQLSQVISLFITMKSML